MSITAELVLAALLSLPGHRPQGTARSPTDHHTGVRACIEAHRTQIIRIADRAHDEAGVPYGIMLAVGRRESHLGCTGSRSWGAPHSRSHRFGLSLPHDAALALNHSFRVCGNWHDAVSRFRSGHCVLPARRPGVPDRWRLHREYVLSVSRDVPTIYAQLGLELPANLEHVAR